MMFYYIGTWDLLGGDGCSLGPSVWGLGAQGSGFGSIDLGFFVAFAVGISVCSEN